MKVVINPGHYPGLDPGAVSPDTGLTEAEVCLSIARILREMLPESTLIQANELWQITQAANNTAADIFVSIHANAAENSLAKGTETYSNPESLAGRRLASFIHEEMVGIGLVDRGVKE